MLLASSRLSRRSLAAQLLGQRWKQHRQLSPANKYNRAQEALIFREDRAVIAGRQAVMQLISDAPWRTEAIGSALGRLLQAGDVICLSGELGAGKTVFSRGLGSGWGATPPLTSPTYNLVHEHRRAQGGERLSHIDLYRISGPAEAQTLGIEEIFDGDDIVILEWPERIRAILPPEHVWIDIELAEAQQRHLVMSAAGERFVALIDALRRDLSAPC